MNHTPEAIAAEQFFEESSLAVIKPPGGADDNVVPRVLRFPILVLGTLLLSAAGYSLLAGLGDLVRDLGLNGNARGASGVNWVGDRGELSAVSRTLRGWWEVGAVIGWRT